MPVEAPADFDGASTEDRRGSAGSVAMEASNNKAVAFCCGSPRSQGRAHPDKEPARPHQLARCPAPGPGRLRRLRTENRDPAFGDGDRESDLGRSGRPPGTGQSGAGRWKVGPARGNPRPRARAEAGGIAPASRLPACAASALAASARCWRPVSFSYRHRRLGRRERRRRRPAGQAAGARA
jgi:hypothetical protein